jgi:hypothetical protein
MAASVSTLDALLKNVYLPGLPVWFNQNRILWQRLEKITDKKRFKGRKFIFAAKDGNPQGVGARTEGDTLPTPGNTSLVNMELSTKKHYATARLTADIISQADSDAGAFAEAVDLEVMGSVDELKNDLALNMVYGAGFGELGKIAASGVSGTTLTMEVQPTIVGGVGSRFFKKNMLVESYTALTGGSAGAASRTVSAVTPSASTITVDANTGFTAADYVFRNGTRGKVMMGLGGILDDGTRVGTFQTLSRTTYPLLKANVLGNSGTLRAWTPELMDSMFAEGWNNGGGAWPSAAYSRLEIQQRAASYIRADRRADMKEMTLDNGYKAVSWTTPDGQKPWFVDQYCRPNEVQAVKEDDLFLAILEDVQWEKRDGTMWRFTDRTHELEAWLYTFLNLGARQCNNHTVLRDVSHTL